MKRVVAIHQPNYLPGLRFFAKLLAADVFVLLDRVPYSKEGWTNRNRIRTAQGVRWLTVPVVTRGRFAQPIEAIEVVSHSRWRQVHLRTLREAYARAPYRTMALPALEPAYASGERRLAQLNEALLRGVMEVLGIRRPLLRASELEVSGSSTELLVSICRTLRASAYLSGQGGRKYLDPRRFEAAGIAVRWQEFQHPVYPQVHGEFVPDLSVVDLLANCGPESLDLLRAGERILT